MPSNAVVRVRRGAAEMAERLREEVAAIRAELDLPEEFPAEVREAAERAAAHPRLPDLDRTDLPFVTIDPEGAQDLDQALHLQRNGSGYVVHYAIADVAAFVTAGDPVDVEAHERGQTLYGAESRVPLHPPAISEDAGSLLAGQVRPALLWTIRLDETGEGTDVHVERALVRSREQLTYEEAQARLDDGSTDEVLLLLKEVGGLREARDAERGGISLPLPDQEVDVEDGHWTLSFREQLPVERWNAQISLLTGFAAATLMVEARVGLLRTLPPPAPEDVARLRRTAEALEVAWPDDQAHPDFIRGLDPAVPAHAAVVVASARLLRGSGYVAFDGELPAERQHSALASEYAHVTAPLRRLCDRFTGEVCVALCAGEEVPGWVRDALPELPGEMARSGQRARSYERAVLDLVEAGLLADRVGQELTAVVVSVQGDDPRRGVVVLPEHGVEAPVTGDVDLPLGTRVTVVVEEADLASRSVLLRLRT